MSSDHETIEIHISRIEPDPLLPNKRKVSPEWVRGLASSIKQDGLLHPLVVRRNPSEPNCYYLLAGQHRYHALMLLKCEVVRCTVITGEVSPESVSLAENCWVRQLPRKEYYDWLQAWHKIHKQLEVERIERERRAAAFAAQQKASSQDAPQESGVDSAPTTEAEAGEEPSSEEPAKASTDLSESVATPPVATGDAVKAKRCRAKVKPGRGRPKSADSELTSRMANATGRSRQQCYKDKKIIESFSSEERDLLFSRNISQEDVLAIAGMSQPARSECVKNIGMGMGVSNAMEAARAAHGSSARDVTNSESDLDDQRWLEWMCGEHMKTLPPNSREIFANDAIFWRRTRRAMQSLRAAIASEASQLPATSIPGAFRSRLERIAKTSHPRNWLVCSACSGIGSDEFGVRCKSCGGRGYVLREEVLS